MGLPSIARSFLRICVPTADAISAIACTADATPGRSGMPTSQQDSVAQAPCGGSGRDSSLWPTPDLAACTDQPARMNPLRRTHRASSRGVLSTGLRDQEIATSECGKGLSTVSVQQLQPVGACRHGDDKVALAWQRPACSSDSGQECIGYINETARRMRLFSPLHLTSHTLAPILILTTLRPKNCPTMVLAYSLSIGGTPNVPTELEFLEKTIEKQIFTHASYNGNPVASVEHRADAPSDNRPLAVSRAFYLPPLVLSSYQSSSCSLVLPSSRCSAKRSCSLSLLSSCRSCTQCPLSFSGSSLIEGDSSSMLIRFGCPSSRSRVPWSQTTQARK